MLRMRNVWVLAGAVCCVGCWGRIGGLLGATDAGANADSSVAVDASVVLDGGLGSGDAGALDPTTPDANAHLPWFVWPLHFRPGVAERIDLGAFVPGYLPGQTRIEVVPVDSEGLQDSTPLPSFIAVEQARYLAYDGSDAGSHNASSLRHEGVAEGLRRRTLVTLFQRPSRRPEPMTACD